MTNTLLLLATLASFQQPSVTAFTDVTVIPMDRERIVPGQTVLVREGRIAEVGPSGRVRIPEGAVRIDARGKFLIPGLAEMHAHLPGPQNPAFREQVMFMYLAGGVTTIRSMLGHPTHLELRAQAARNEIWSPIILTSGPSLNGNSAPTPDAARRMVEEQKAAGYDLLKIHPGLSRATFDTMVATANRVGIPFAGHVPADVGAARAIEARYATIDHIDAFPELLAGAPPGTNGGFFGIAVTGQVDMSRMPAIARQVRDAGIWIVPTQTLFETVAGGTPVDEMTRWPGMEFMPPQVVQQWTNYVSNFRQQNDRGLLDRYLVIRRRMIRDLHAAGAGILLGSDAPQWMNPPGFSALRELESYVRSGLTPFQALQTGTVNVARYFGTPNEFGTVQAGRRADLVLLDANPLEDIANVNRIAGVMVRGRWLSRTEIDQRLAAFRS
jgi:imidazolonepropionase-like amidohydrolase